MLGSEGEGKGREVMGRIKKGGSVRKGSEGEGKVRGVKGTSGSVRERS